MNRRYREREKAKRKVIDHKCPECGHKWSDTKPHKVYCSDNCNDIANKEKTKARKRKYYLKTKAKKDADRKTVFCKLASCGKEFKQTDGRLFCCLDHQKESNRLSKLKPVVHRMCEKELCSNKFYTHHRSYKYCRLDSCGGNKVEKVEIVCAKTNCSNKFYRKKSNHKNCNLSTCGGNKKVSKKPKKPKVKITKKAVKKPKAPKAVLVKNVNRTRSKTVLVEKRTDFKEHNIVPVESVPTMEEPPKIQRKDRQKEVTAPRDGTYGEGMQEAIAEFLKKQKDKK
jgi:endogenous inhibitor of DNA gyrase (YacG/DUF329 family)